MNKNHHEIEASFSDISSLLHRVEFFLSENVNVGFLVGEVVGDCEVSVFIVGTCDGGCDIVGEFVGVSVGESLIEIYITGSVSEEFVHGASATPFGGFSKP